MPGTAIPGGGAVKRSALTLLTFATSRRTHPSLAAHQRNRHSRPALHTVQVLLTCQSVGERVGESQRTLVRVVHDEGRQDLFGAKKCALNWVAT